MLHSLTAPMFPYGIRCIGLSFILAVTAALVNPTRPSRETQLASFGILSALLVPMVGSFSGLSLASGLAGLSIYTLMMTGRFHGDVLDWLVRMNWQLTSGSASRKSTASSRRISAAPTTFGVLCVIILRGAGSSEFP